MSYVQGDIFKYFFRDIYYNLIFQEIGKNLTPVLPAIGLLASVEFGFGLEKKFKVLTI